jgi:hypothetical protein
MAAMMMAAVAVGTSLMSSAMAPKDQTWKGEAKKQGKHKANVMMQRNRAWEQLPKEAAAVQKNAMLAEVTTEMGAAQAIAQTEVQAAAAGAAGGSADLAIIAMEGNTAHALQDIAQQEAVAVQQLERKWEDIFWESDSQDYDLTFSGGARNVLGEAAVAGVSAYSGAKFQQSMNKPTTGGKVS